MNLKNKYNNIIPEDSIANKLNEHKNYLIDEYENDNNKITENIK